MGCGSSNAGNLMRQQQQQQQALTEQSVNQINQAFGGFNPQFYKGISNAYLAYALPQLWNQYSGMRNQLGYNLANQGILNSTAAQQGQQQLGQAMASGQANIGSQAVQQAQNLQQQVAQQKANLMAQAQSATSPSSIGQQATAMAGSLSGPSYFAPIGNMFSGLGQLFAAQQAANTYNPWTNYYNRVGYGAPLPSTATYVR